MQTPQSGMSIHFLWLDVMRDFVMVCYFPRINQNLTQSAIVSLTTAAELIALTQWLQTTILRFSLKFI